MTGCPLTAAESATSFGVHPTFQCYEDADAVAFMEMQPVNTGHVVVAPRTHYDSLLMYRRKPGDRLFR